MKVNDRYITRPDKSDAEAWTEVMACAVSLGATPETADRLATSIAQKVRERHLVADLFGSLGMETRTVPTFTQNWERFRAKT